MREDEIRQLIRLLEENEGIGEIEMSVSPFGGKRIRVSRRGQAATAAPAVPSPAPAPSPQAKTVADLEIDSDLHTVKAPMVGTFYRASNPDADSFVNEGSKVSPGTVLCIIEAMKLMNEIECDVAGVVQEILVENGQAVEFGQPLFHVGKL